MVHPVRVDCVRCLVVLCVLATAIYSGSSAVHAQQVSSSSGTSASDATAVNTGNLINWFDCSSLDAKDLPTAQCAQYKAPLCYEGICEDAKKRTIDVFFKRIQAKDDPETKPNVWFLQGGSSASLPTMEVAMTSLYTQLNGGVNVYTMDRRGSSRGTRLDCIATQVTTSGSPNARDLGTDEVSSCAEELEIKFGKDLSAFSITSAATDISTFISKYQSGSKTFVYGVSYGSALVERLMHLDTKEIVGYILDGVSTTSGADVKDGMYMSNWDVNFGEVGDRFLSLCASDPKCSSRFPTRSIQETLKQSINESSREVPCSEVYRFGGNDRLHGVQNVLGTLLANPETRGIIPAILYRTNRCNSDDFNLFYKFMGPGLKSLLTASDDSASNSTLLHYLTVFSEMWETPTPSFDILTSRFNQASMSTGPIASKLPLYCLFTKDSSSGCAAYTKLANYSASPIVYKKDKYWNIAASIPDQASVLLMSGKLDPQTPHKYAERLYKVLNGTKKELVVFDYAAHGTLFNTALPGAASGAPTCGMSILASYIANNGDLSKLNKSCMSSLQMSFEVSKEVSRMLFDTSEPYDGKVEYSRDTYPPTEDKYMTPFYIVLAVVIVLLVAAIILHRWHKNQKAARAAATATAAGGATSSQRSEATQDIENDRLEAGVPASPTSNSGGGEYKSVGEPRTS